jgi:hypothetical protein
MGFFKIFIKMKTKEKTEIYRKNEGRGEQQEKIIKEPLEFVKCLFFPSKIELETWIFILYSLNSLGTVQLNRANLETFLRRLKDGENTEEGIKKKVLRILHTAQNLKAYLSVKELKYYIEKRKEKGLSKEEKKILKKYEPILNDNKQFIELKVLENVEENGYGLKATLNELLSLFLNDFKNGFIAYKMEEFLTLKSIYSKILFRELLSVKAYGVLRLTEEDILKLMKVKKGFKKKSDLIGKGIYKALKELEISLGMEIQVKKYRGGKGGGIKELEIIINSLSKQVYESKVEKHRKRGSKFEDIKKELIRDLATIGEGKEEREKIKNALEWLNFSEKFSPTVLLIYVLENLKLGKSLSKIKKEILKMEMNADIYSENFILNRFKNTESYKKYAKYKDKLDNLMREEWKGLRRG